MKIENKKCSKCGELKTINEFCKNKYTKDNYNCWCKDCCNKLSEIWRKNNPDKAKELRDKWYINNPEKLKRSCKRWRDNNSKKVKEYNRIWNKNNPVKRLAYEIKRVALKKGIISEDIDLLQVYENHNWECGVCGKKINPKLKFPNPKSKSLDHILPLSKGGNHVSDNIRPAHLGCNSSKGNRIKNLQLKLQAI